MCGLVVGEGVAGWQVVRGGLVRQIFGLEFSPCAEIFLAVGLLSHPPNVARIFLLTTARWRDKMSDIMSRANTITRTHVSRIRLSVMSIPGEFTARDLWLAMGAGFPFHNVAVELQRMRQRGEIVARRKGSRNIYRRTSG